MVRIFALFMIFALAACGPDRPTLDARISDAARNAPPPRLLPLDPILDDSAATPAREAEAEGRALQSRAEDLRRRAAEQRRRPI